MVKKQGSIIMEETQSLMVSHRLFKPDSRHSSHSNKFKTEVDHFGSRIDLNEPITRLNMNLRNSEKKSRNSSGANTHNSKKSRSGSNKSKSSLDTKAKAKLNSAKLKRRIMEKD